MHITRWCTLAFAEYAEIQLERFILGAESKHVVQMQDEKRVGTRVELRYIVLSIGYDVSKSSGSIKSWSLLCTWTRSERKGGGE